jgi:NADH dehydrogenase
MNSLEPRLVTVFGGSGFVGTQVAQELARRGHRVRVAVRRPNLSRHVTLLGGGVGQVVRIQANVRNLQSIERAIAGADMVVNLVGIGYEKGEQTFAAIHNKAAVMIADAAKRLGATHLIHMSALGVDKAAKVSVYADSKLAGERGVLQAFPSAVIVRPSLMFGQDDGFFNQMGALARMLPVLPLIGADTRFQPVFVGDVAEAIAMAADGLVRTGRIYEFGGPQVETNRELMERIKRETQRNRPLLPLPKGIAKLMAIPFKILPGRPLLTADQVELLHVDNVVSEEAIGEKRTFAAFGITPTSMDNVLPSYMWRFRKHGQFDRTAADTAPNA